MNIQKILVQADKVCTYVPIISNVSNLVDLFLKHVYIPENMDDWGKNEEYFQHLKDKSSRRCVILALCPIISNIFFGIYDWITRENRHKKAELINQLRAAGDGPVKDVLKNAPKHLFDHQDFHLAVSAGQIGSIKSMGNGVYTAEAMAPTGEKIYMAMESLESSDREKWERYRDMAILLTQGGMCDYTIGSFTEIGSRLNDEAALKEFLAARTFPNFWTSDPKNFEQLCDKLRDRKIACGSPKAEELKVIHHASCGMNVEKQSHVVYVSKVPVTSRVNFVTPSKSFDFRSIVEMYGDLIMSVGVTISDVVENRGIFRNPLSIIDGGYGSLAMMLHKFTCLVVKEAFPEVTTFKVRPLKKMGELFLNSLPKHLVTVNGIPGDQYNKGFDREQDVGVPVDVLANLKMS